MSSNTYQAAVEGVKKDFEDMGAKEFLHYVCMNVTRAARTPDYTYDAIMEELEDRLCELEFLEGSG